MSALFDNARTWPVALVAAAMLLMSAPVCAQPQVQLLEDFELRDSEEIARANQLRAILEDRGLSEEQVRVTDFEGQDRTPELLGPRVPGDVPPRLGERQVVVRPAETISMRLPTERSDLPGGVAQIEDSGRDPETGDGWFHPSLFSSPIPAIWDDDLHQYTTRLSIGLRGENVPPGIELEQPVTVQLGFSGLTAEPIEQITLRRPGIEHERHLDFQFVPTTDQPTLKMRSSIVDVDFEIEAMPRIAILPESDSMTGLGLEEIQINVRRLKPHGDFAPASDDLLAAVTVSGAATPDSSELNIEEGTVGTSFALRSSGLSDATIRVSDGQHTASRTIEQRFPIGPVLAALFGGAIGGFARRFMKKAPPITTGTRIVEGLIAAIVVYVASVLGAGYFNVLPPAIAATEAGAFLTGAASGFVGVAVFEAFRRNLVRTGSY
ncbi:hypothetical protein IC757_00760 [Wenzhouxiangella sp. AB-CW3]|uniref:hypothetical protein n=1 Tax=Wenzhouxiangella sp. AB-CW3 TaxID=2771012 RepID=UPI00168B3D35|nr:hypothetical protein [Wenzhouxiangella sp. AB-CW3]QOC22732.1 hypothetical protein IC757_00760 [Wenzhouxiangella sp. AB-CW3]